MTGLALRMDGRRPRAAVARLAAALDDPGRVLDEVARRLAESADRRFARGGRRASIADAGEAGAGHPAFHRLGGGAPARPSPGLSDDDRSAALAIVRRAVERAVR